MVGFLGLSCVFSLAGVLFGGLGFPRKKTPRKPEPQLKQTHSSNHKTSRLFQRLHNPYCTSPKLEFYSKEHAFGALSTRTQAWNLCCDGQEWRYQVF